MHIENTILAHFRIVVFSQQQKTASIMLYVNLYPGQRNNSNSAYPFLNEKGTRRQINDQGLDVSYYGKRLRTFMLF